MYFIDTLQATVDLWGGALLTWTWSFFLFKFVLLVNDILYSFTPWFFFLFFKFVFLFGLFFFLTCQRFFVFFLFSHDFLSFYIYQLIVTHSHYLTYLTWLTRFSDCLLCVNSGSWLEKKTEPLCSVQSVNTIMAHLFG